MQRLQVQLTAISLRIQARLPWLRKLMQYSFMFFLVKGLLWTALVVYPLVRGIQG